MSMLVLQVVLTILLFFVDILPRAAKASLADGIIHLIAGFVLGLVCAAFTIAGERHRNEPLLRHHKQQVDRQ